MLTFYLSFLALLVRLPQGASYIAPSRQVSTCQRTLWLGNRRGWGVRNGCLGGEQPTGETGSTPFDLPGDWNVETGEGSKSSPPSTPEPEPFQDGRDWGEWAREWNQDPAGKADRLIKQWEAESAEKVAKQSLSVKPPERKSKEKKGFAQLKGKAKAKARVKARGDNKSAERELKGGGKGVPDNLVVKEVGIGGEEDISGLGEVDWSQGQQLVESKEKDFVADIEADIARIAAVGGKKGLTELEQNLRSALGKLEMEKNKKTKKEAAPTVTDVPNNSIAREVEDREVKIEGSPTGEGATPIVADVLKPESAPGRPLVENEGQAPSGGDDDALLRSFGMSVARQPDPSGGVGVEEGSGVDGNGEPGAGDEEEEAKRLRGFGQSRA